MLPPWRRTQAAVGVPAEKERARNWEERKQQSNWAQSRPTHGSETSPNMTHNNTQGKHDVRALQQPPNAAHAERAISEHPPPPSTRELLGSYSSPCGSKYSRNGPVTRSPPSQLTKHSSCTRQSSNSRKQDMSSTRGCNKWAAGPPPSSTGRGAKNGKRNSMLHRWQSHTRCWWTSTGRRDGKSFTRTAHPRTIPRWGGWGATGCTSVTHGTPQHISPVRSGRRTIEVSSGRRCMRFNTGIRPSRHSSALTLC